MLLSTNLPLFKYTLTIDKLNYFKEALYKHKVLSFILIVKIKLNGENVYIVGWNYMAAWA